MKVKIGKKIYDSNEEPIMLILDGTDKQNISQMTGEATKYCSFPDNHPLEEITQFMKVEEEESTSPYCPICESCGEDGCCPAANCRMDPAGHYCETNLLELRFRYWMYKDLMNLVYDDPKYKEKIDELWDKNYDSIFRK